MILVLGGTTEGRRAVEVLDKAGEPFYYSTRSDLQEVESRNAIRISGGLDRDGMRDFCIRNGVSLIVDAAHPFASLLHATAADVSRSLGIPVVRYERRYPRRNPDFEWCDGYEDAAERMLCDGVKRLLALTGVQTISRLRPFWEKRDCRFRILNRPESLEKVKSAGFPEEKILFYDEENAGISGFIESLHPDAIITKESGASGGFTEKVEEALRHNLRVYVVKRPEMPEEFVEVTGPFGLRREIEGRVPGFFKLRSGFTTGSCAAAAAKAAMTVLAKDEYPEEVTIMIPDGERMRLKVDSVRRIDENTAEAVVVKNAGDDPDVTNGCRIIARVSIREEENSGDVEFIGGDGIGRVTLPGTGLAIGEAAINPAPREMMRRELRELWAGACTLEISVPGGEELAKRTFNSRIGIEGGISIIGTSGIVMPFSNEAFIEAIRREIEVARASGCPVLVLNSGARSEKVVKAEYPELPDIAFVHYGNAIGESLGIAAELGVENVVVGLMIGKAVKLAEGNADTHSHKVVMNRDFLATLAREAGCSADAGEKISGLNMARELWADLTPEDAGKFSPHLLSRCKEVCRRYYPEGRLTLHLITDNGEIAATL